MNFVTYVNNRFEEITVMMAGAKEFNVLKDAELNCLQFVLAVYRKFLMVLYIPKVLFGFGVMKLGMAKRLPEPVLQDLQREFNARKDKKAKKLGFKPSEGV